MSISPCVVEGCIATVTTYCNECGEAYCAEHAPAPGDHPHALVDIAEQAALQQQQREREERARCCETLAATTDMPTIAQAMRDFSFDARIQVLALERVRNVARDDASARPRAISCGILAALLSALTAHASDTSVIVNALNALCVLANFEGHQSAIASAGGVQAILSILTQHISDTSIVIEACRALASTSTIYKPDDDSVLFANADNQQLIASAGGIETLLNVLRDHSSNAGVVEHVCLALAAIAQGYNSKGHYYFEDGNQHFLDDESALAIATANSIPQLLKAMREHASDAAVVERACHALDKIAAPPANASKIVAAGGIVIIIKTMRDHASNATVVRHACRTLSDLACNDESKSKIAAVRGIEAVTKVVQDHSQDASVVKAACATLKSLSTLAANKLKIADAGGVDTLSLTCLRIHASNADVVQQVCETVRSVVIGFSENCNRAATAECLEALLQAFRSYPKNERIRDPALSAAMNMAMHADQRVRTAFLEKVPKEVRELTRLGSGTDLSLAIMNSVNDSRDRRFLYPILRSHNVRRYIEALREHASDARSVHVLCCSLAPLLQDDNNKVGFVAAGGIEAMIKALRDHPSHEGVVGYACVLLANVSTMPTQAHARKIVAAGGIPVFMRALRDHEANANLALTACEALVQLGSSNGIPAQIAAAGGIEALLNTMRRHPSEFEVIRNAWIVLSRMFILNEEYVAKIVRSGGAAVFIRAIRDYGSKCPVLGGGVHLLTRMARLEAAQVKMVKAGGIEVLLKAMRDHPSNSGLISDACEVLSFIVDNAAGRAVFFSAGGVDTVLKAIRDHPNTEHLVVRACVALGSINDRLTAHSADAIELLLKALRDYPLDEHVARYTPRALGNLAIGHAENTLKFVAAGGVDAMLKLMRDHAADADVLGPACSALAAISTSNDETVIVAATDGVEALVKALRDHQQNAFLTVKACRALANLTHRSADSRGRVVRAGGIELLVKALRVNAHGLAEDACCALTNVSSEPEFKVQIIAAGGIEELVRTMRDDTTYATVVSNVCRTLANIAAIGADHQARIARAGGGEPLLSALDAHASEPSVHHNASLAIYNLCTGESADDIRQLFVQADAIAILSRAHSRFVNMRPRVPTDPDLPVVQTSVDAPAQCKQDCARGLVDHAEQALALLQ